MYIARVQGVSTINLVIDLFPTVLLDALNYKKSISDSTIIRTYCDQTELNFLEIVRFTSLKSDCSQ